MGSCEKCGSEFTPMSHACGRDKDALSSLRARVAELERERDEQAERAVLAEAECARLVRSHDDGVPVMRELHARASAAEQRAKRMEVALKRLSDWPESTSDHPSITSQDVPMRALARAALAESGDEPYCACGRRVSECDGSRAGCLERVKTRAEEVERE